MRHRLFSGKGKERENESAFSEEKDEEMRKGETSGKE